MAFWEGRRLGADANDLLAMIDTWQQADISANHIYNGDFGYCSILLGSIQPSHGKAQTYGGVAAAGNAAGRREARLKALWATQQVEQNRLWHYDNIPDTIFNGGPTLKTWKNRQRASIITSVLGSETPVIKSTGLQGWLTEDREQCLMHRQTTELFKPGTNIDKRICGQWLRIPTKEVADLVKAILEQSRTVLSYRHKGNNGKALAFPETAY